MSALTDDPWLSITSAAGTVNLNEIRTTGKGIEAGKGTTGLGLPPVEAQFSDTAGDGARFRWKRVGQRNVEIVIQILDGSRELVEGHFDRLAEVLEPGTLTVTWHVPTAGVTWDLECTHAAGGDYATGEDEDGYVLLTSITLQSTSPYWVSPVETVEAVADPAANSPFEITTTNTGSKGALPVWTITGPTNGWVAQSESGELLAFEGYIPDGVSVTVDCNDGTVVDSNGGNAYGLLGVNPQFFEIPKGESTILMEADRSSADFLSAKSRSWYNHVLNPEFGDGLNNYERAGATLSGSRARFTESTLVDLEPVIRTTVTDLTVGERYHASLSLRTDSRPMGLSFTGQQRLGPKIQVKNGDQVLTRNWSLRKGMDPAAFYRVWIWFTATSPEAEFSFYPERKKGLDNKWRANDAYVEKWLIGGAGPADKPRVDPATFFSGATPDTSKWNYSWEGVAHQSRSIAQLITPTDISGFSVELTYKPRKWLVI